MSIWTNGGFNGEMQAFLDLEELVISSDTAAALEAYRTVRAFVQSLLYFFPPFLYWLVLHFLSCLLLLSNIICQCRRAPF